MNVWKGRLLFSDCEHKPIWKMSTKVTDQVKNVLSLTYIQIGLFLNLVQYTVCSFCQACCTSLWADIKVFHRVLSNSMILFIFFITIEGSSPSFYIQKFLTLGSKNLTKTQRNELMGNSLSLCETIESEDSRSCLAISGCLLRHCSVSIWSVNATIGKALECTFFFQELRSP